MKRSSKTVGQIALLLFATLIVCAMANAQELMDKEILGYTMSADGSMKVVITTTRGDNTRCPTTYRVGYATEKGKKPLYFCYRIIDDNVHAVYPGEGTHVFDGRRFIVNTMHAQKPLKK